MLLLARRYAADLDVRAGGELSSALGARLSAEGQCPESTNREERQRHELNEAAPSAGMKRSACGGFRRTLRAAESHIQMLNEAAVAKPPECQSKCAKVDGKRANADLRDGPQRRGVMREVALRVEFQCQLG